MLFLTGTNDPWRQLSLRPDNNTNRRLRTFSVSGGAHCSELDSAKGGNAEARRTMNKAFRDWTARGYGDEEQRRYPQEANSAVDHHFSNRLLA